MAFGIGTDRQLPLRIGAILNDILLSKVAASSKVPGTFHRHSLVMGDKISLQ